MIGRAVGHYTIVEKIGEGGMGEVYRATDTSLARDVALKFLPESMAQDETARARFVREARSAAALTHSYICQIYEIGEADGAGYIAMEYVAGQTLRETMEGTQLPVTECLRLAAEIAEALSVAQEKGIIHRDLKPANIMIGADGHVKVMDFGLAKRVDGDEFESQMQGLRQTLTREGTVVGTLAYMSPEQIRGLTLDSRSDIFSFGIILYEMLTGVHPFIKTDPYTTANAIVNEEPVSVSLQRSGVSTVVQYIVRKMLAKEPERRYQLVREVHTDLSGLQESSPPTHARPETSTHHSSPLLWLLIPLALLAGWAGWWGQGVLAPVPPADPFHAEINLPSGTRLEHNYQTGLAVSPNGEYLVFPVGDSRGTSLGVAQPNQLFRRNLEDASMEPLGEIRNVQAPVFSPDSSWVVYFTWDEAYALRTSPTGSFLMKAPVTGGRPRELLAWPGGQFGGIGWDEAGIVYARDGVLVIISEEGVERDTLEPFDPPRNDVRFPSFFPGGGWVLFTEVGDTPQSASNIHAISVGDRETKPLVDNATHARYVPSGHLVYAREGNLYAQRFDPTGLSSLGSEVLVIEQISHSIRHVTSGAAQFSFSDTGLMIYAESGIAPPVPAQADQDALRGIVEMIFPDRLRLIENWFAELERRAPLR